jgi:malonyl-CoA decarboxylase
MAPLQPARLFDRTLRHLRERWRDIAGSGRIRLTGEAFHPGLPDADLARVRERIEECVQGRGGEVSARARAADLGRLYLALDDDGRRRFLDLLANDFAHDPAAVARAAKAYLDAGDVADQRTDAERALKEALFAPRLRLLMQFNALPEGVKFLVDLRATVMRLAREDAAMAGLDEEIRALLASWFDVGFLDLRRITWDSPAALLEKLITYEAVHAIRSWQDLKNRLDSDRRCFAFFHPRMPEEPLIFVEVALVRAMADNIQVLLDEAAEQLDPGEASAAIFYSISNAQRGLAGISFGNFLIKRVVDGLAADFPRIQVFATLSPIPGFRAWLDPLLAAATHDLFVPAEAQALMKLAGATSGAAALGALLATEWSKDESACAAMEAPLMRLAARYLARETRPDGRPRDAVARFHLANGARIERLNWLADTSAKGLKESAGLMVNYLYRQSEIEANHEAYEGEGRVTVSGAVSGLLKR